MANTWFNWMVQKNRYQLSVSCCQTRSNDFKNIRRYFSIAKNFVTIRALFAFKLFAQISIFRKKVPKKFIEWISIKNSFRRFLFKIWPIRILCVWLCTNCFAMTLISIKPPSLIFTLGYCLLTYFCHLKRKMKSSAVSFFNNVIFHNVFFSIVDSVCT